MFASKIKWFQLNILFDPNKNYFRNNNNYFFYCFTFLFGAIENYC